MSLTINTERFDQYEIRYLPPSCMRDHFESMKALTDLQGVSFKTFWKTWHEQFPFLKLRSSSIHAQCSVCVRHKLLVRGLSNHLSARRHQIDLLSAHLRKQYLDRQTYWALRGSARLRTFVHMTAIIDSMDQVKFLYPRSALVYAKELSNFQRPKLHVTLCIGHGHSFNFYVSNHNHAKDSSVMTEIVAHFVGRLAASGVNLPEMHLHLQADNTPRELKNNTLLRFLTACTSHRYLASVLLYCFCSLGEKMLFAVCLEPKS